jgi:hypothetical protein
VGNPVVLQQLDGGRHDSKGARSITVIG